MAKLCGIPAELWTISDFTRVPVAERTAVPVTATFMLDGSGNPVGAQKSPTPENQYWARVWEKAYGEFKNLTRSNPTGCGRCAGNVSV